MIMNNLVKDNVFKPWCKNRKCFLRMTSSIDRTLLTWHATPISLIKQNMHILIMFNSNHCWFILTILPTTIQQNTKLHALPLIYQSIWLGFCVLFIIKGAAMTNTPAKCVYIGPIDGLTNTYTNQNTKHKMGFNVNILCAQEQIVNFIWKTLKCKCE